MSSAPVIRVKVEQALAYGRSLDWMREHLGVEPAYVEKVRRYLDRVNDEADRHIIGRPRSDTPTPKRQKTGRRWAPCGTHSAYARHKKRGEEVDDACMRAEARNTARRRAERKRAASVAA